MSDHIVSRARPILDAALAADGVAAFSEDFERGLHDDRLNHSHFTEASEDGTVVALAALAPDGSCEMVVHPKRRRAGYGTRLVEQVRQDNPDAGFWAHGNIPAAQGFARALGMQPVRELLVMKVDSAEIDAEVELPEGYRAVSYADAVEGGEQEVVDKQLLDVNNDAFSWHPEQGGWDLERLRRGMDTDWFDAKGLWLLYKGDDLAGFHWTKRHSDGTGEVYVIGLGSAYRGEGMGVPLLLMGLKYLVEAGSPQVILYVEADNEAAVGLYRRLGFKVDERHIVYR